MVFDREEDHLVAADEVQDQIVVHDVFPQVVARLKHPRRSFTSVSALVDCTVRSRKEQPDRGKRRRVGMMSSNNRRQQARETSVAVGTEKDIDGGEIPGEVFGEDRTFTGHAAT